MDTPIDQSPGAVVHLDEAGGEKHAAVLQSLSNLVNEMGAGFRVELLHGPGVDVCLPGGATAAAVSLLIEAGVTFAACENTMRQRNIGADQLLPGVTTVPSGVAELVRRQLAGWAYIRP